MYALPTAPQALGGVLDDGFRLFRATWRRLLPISIACALISIVPNILLGTVMPASPEAGPPDTGWFASFGVAIVVTVLLSLLAYGAMLAGVDAVARTGTTRLTEAIGIGLRRAPALIGASFLVSIAIFVGFVLLVIPGVWLSVALCLAFILPVVERLGPLQSCRRSMELVKGSWWRTAGVMTVLIIIVVVLSLVASFVVGLALAPFLTESNAMLGGIAIQVIATLLWSPFLPLSYCLTYAVYADLRLRKDGADLLARAELGTSGQAGLAGT